MPDVDIERPDELTAYLRRTGRIGRGECVRICILGGGVSNRTVAVDRETGERWVLKQALEKLRVPEDWFSSPERIHREALGLKWLVNIAPPGAVTPLLFEDPEHHLLAMQAVPQPHDDWKAMLLAGRIQLDHFRQFATILATIHREAYRRRAELEEVFAERSFFESLRLEPYYAYAAEQVPAAAAYLHALICDTRARRITLVHGDYSPKNILVHKGRLVLLDHEVIHFGDPAFDLGFSLTHFLSKAHHLPALRREFAEATMEYWRVYAETLGALPWAAELEARAVRHTLGCLLARVAGRSPLEYLDAAARHRQLQAVLSIMRVAPATIAGLIRMFEERMCLTSNL